MLISDARKLQVRPGESARAWLGVGTSWFGPVQIPLYVARGPVPGPKMVAMACQHGDEGYGVLGLLDVIQEMDPAVLRGELWLLPCVNVFGYVAGQRASPYDHQDMNRVHPGRPDGTMTEQIAGQLYDQVFPGADLLLDLHGGSPENGDSSFGRWTDAPGKPSVHPILSALDLDFLLAPGNTTPGMLSAVTPALGTPQISIEAGACLRYARDNAQQMAAFVYSCMRSLGMLPGPPPSPRDLPLMRTASLRAQAGGAYKTLVSFGEKVARGQRLGYVMDLLGNVAQEVSAPDDGVVAVMRTGVRVHPGESLITLAVPA